MLRELYRIVTSGDVDGLANLIGRRSERAVSAGLTTPIQMEACRYKPPLNILNQFTPGGNTTLHLASFLGHLQIVQNLLQHITETLGNERSRHFILLQNLKWETALHEAAMGGHYQILDILLRESADQMVHITNNAGESALLKAAEGGHGEIVARLLSLISPDYDMRRTCDGQTPVHAAVFGAHKDVIESLLKQRPDLLTQADHFGKTPLHIVAFSKNASQIAKLLLQRSDPNSLCYMVDANHQSAFHLAVIEGKTVGIRLQGKTPLEILLEKMSNDERLYSRMKTSLQMIGARSTPKIVEEEALGTSLATQKWREKNQIISFLIQ